ncbi:hypothetical protein D1B31_23770 [Neobacillus notoginsengisoli]|uniref:Uncharacterized protein n=1 Tax=Neobacillus notoginsengisoli TaxID=1578198 RepID=A0A417YC76_9BACI|nr:hypothetical protein [Neobacillus notoginsengisoli]RHW30289.1 hypothetical protein D1B31_23770 [Neobacillus notoginsengisoli]
MAQGLDSIVGLTHRIWNILIIRILWGDYTMIIIEYNSEKKNLIDYEWAQMIWSSPMGGPKPKYLTAHGWAHIILVLKGMAGPMVHRLSIW